MDNLMRGAVGVASLGFMVFGGNLAYQDKTATATVTFGIAIICLIFFFLSRFKKFKGFGIEAETWEEKMEEAEKLVGNLNKLSLVTSEFLLSVGSKLGRLDGHLTKKERHELLAQTLKILESNKTPADEIAKARRVFDSFIVFDMGYELLEEMRPEIRKLTEPFKNAIGAFGSPIKAEDQQSYSEAIRQHRAVNTWENEIQAALVDKENESLVDNTISAIQSSDLISQEAKDSLLEMARESLEDIRYYQQHRKHRRPEKWFEKDE